MVTTPTLNMCLSFRRGDNTVLSTRIKDRLAGYYKGGYLVSDDVGYLPTAASDTATCIRHCLDSFNVLLIAIGPNWLYSVHRARQRRLDLPDDSARLVIRAALALSKPIVMVLAPTASMRGLSELSASGIVLFQSDATFTGDMRKVYRVLHAKLEIQQRPPIQTSLDDAQPSIARQQILKKFKDTGRAPSARFKIRTIGELDFIARRSGALNPNARRPVSLEEVDMSYANFDGVDLNGFNLQVADLTYTSLAEAQLESVNLTGATLESTNLSKASLKSSKLDQLDLRGANLQGSDLSDAEMEGVRLSGMDLTQVLFGASNLREADLSGADLHGVDLGESVLEGAQLDYTDLSGANLTNANLKGARLTGANLSGAKVHGTTFDSIDVLDYFIVDAKTTLNRAAWGGVSMRQIGEARSRNDRIAALRDTVRINHLIAESLRKRGMLSESSDSIGLSPAASHAA